MATLRQLEYLVTVTELGSFTAAAGVLHVSQPALSHQIAVLERAVGGRLLDRLPRSVRLTPAGRALLPHARAWWDAEVLARVVIEEDPGDGAGRQPDAELQKLSLDAPIAPISVFFGHVQDQRFDLSRRARPSWSALATAIVFLRDQFPVPG